MPVANRRLLAAAAGLAAVAAAPFGAIGFGAEVAGAQPVHVSGGAFGHWTKVGLFGGPAVAVGPAPDVRLPAAGSGGKAMTGAEPDGASAVYGPAHIFGGRWPVNVATAPPSGPISVSTKSTDGPGGPTVTSTADIGLYKNPRPVQCDGDPPGTTKCTVTGGFGPTVPNEGDELHSTCTAGPNGSSGSAHFVKGVLATSTDDSGEPKDTEPIPDDPPPNYTRTGTITNVGDHWKIVYNEQFIDPDGSITVNALHMYLLGDIALGDQILGQVRCSVTGAAFANTPPPAPAAANQPSPSPSNAAATISTTAASSSNNDTALVIGSAVLLAVGITATVLWVRRDQARAKSPPVDARAG
jgi:hypothetical protein